MLSAAEVLLSPEPVASPLCALPLSLRARRGRLDDRSPVSLEPFPDDVELYRSDVAREEPPPVAEDVVMVAAGAAWNEDKGVAEA